MNRAWTKEDDEILKKGCAVGLSFRKIAALMLNARTRNSVIGRAHRLGISPERVAKPVTIKPVVIKPVTIKPFKPVLVLRAKTTAPAPDAGNDFARPWESRKRGECAWPLNGDGGTWSCCAPTAATYCPRHAKIMFIKGDRRLPKFAAR